MSMISTGLGEICMQLGVLYGENLNLTYENASREFTSGKVN